jgi:hypothetical protein
MGDCFISTGWLNNQENIVVKERAHNGNAYNAVVEYIYSLSADMQFHQVLCIESKYMDVMTDCIIVRSLNKNVLVDQLICPKMKAREIGRVELTFSPTAKISEKKIYDGQYKDLLITGSGVDEKQFIVEGFHFRY